MTVWRVAVLAVLLGGMSPAFAAEPLPADEPGAKQEAEKLNNLPPVAPPPATSTSPAARRKDARRSTLTFYQPENGGRPSDEPEFQRRREQEPAVG